MSANLRHAHIVVQFSCPCVRLHLHDVKTGWLLEYGIVLGDDITANVARFRGEMILAGYVVEPGYTVEDWRQPGHFGRPME